MSKLRRADPTVSGASGVIYWLRMRDRKAYYATYRKSESGKKVIQRYEASEKAKQRKVRYYASAPAKANATARERKRKLATRELIDAAKNTPCEDCKGNFATACMDFHHVRGEKLFTIANRRKATEIELRNEIAKCIVLCATCHRIRHIDK